MADAWKKLDRLLEKYKFELVRDSTHLIYRYPKTGEVLTVSRTPSDWRAGQKALSDLRRILQGRHAEPPKPLIDHERLEADKLLRSYDPRALPAARKGKATKGIGFKFLHKSVKALSPDQKAVCPARHHWPQGRKRKTTGIGAISKESLFRSVCATSCTKQNG